MKKKGKNIKRKKGRNGKNKTKEFYKTKQNKPKQNKTKQKRVEGTIKYKD